MKMTRKLIPALVMLLVSAIMLSTASYAWFASSTTVKAGGMTVKAQSAAKFIQISNAADGTFASAANAPDASKSKTSLDLVTADVPSTGTNVAWYVGSSTAPDVVGDTDRTSPVTVNAASNYALVNTFYVKMSEGSTKDLDNLRISEVAVSGLGDNLNKALRILVVGDNAQLWSFETGAWAQVTTEGNQNGFLSKVTRNVASFQVYIYYDGESSVATTDKAVDLQGLSVEITFIGTESSDAQVAVTPAT